MSKNVPDVDVDLYALDALDEPYDNYRLFRDTAAVVRLPKYDLYVLSRFTDVQAALKNTAIFSSASGAAMNDAMNHALTGAMLSSDEPLHGFLRSIVGRPFTPQRLAALREDMTRRAEALAERLCEQRDFDAATDLAQHLPLSVVSELVGLPEEGRDRMLIWAAATFNSFAPRGVPLAESALPIIQEMVAYAAGCTPERVKPGSWTAQLYEAADRGEIDFARAGALMLDYLGPSLDTTIFATSNAVALFAKHPEQWRKLRGNPGKIPNAINEVVRLESPIQAFSRLVIEDFEIEGQTLEAGDRVLMMYGSANRDERRWDNPEAFDIERHNADHLGFGHGVHTCLGANLARLEISALLAALIKRVDHFEAHDSVRAINNLLRGYQSLRVTAHPVAAMAAA